MLFFYKLKDGSPSTPFLPPIFTTFAHMILLFNPSCEMAVRQGRDSYTPPRGIAAMEDDLAALMTFVSADGDSIVGPEPDDELTKFWKPYFGRREYIGWGEASLRARQGEAIAPWGMSKAALRKFGLTDRARLWMWRDLLSRRTSVATEWELARLAADSPAAKPVIATTEAELIAAMADTSRTGNGIVIKSLWSAAGRGVRFFGGREDSDAAMAYGMNCILSDGGAVVETKLRRLAEFSYLFTARGGEVEYEGTNRYHSTEGGAMGWELAGPQPNIYDITAFDSDIAQSATRLATALRNVLAGTGYEGPIGVDAMVYADKDGAAHLRPCTEVNVRHCMGHVAQGVLRATATGASVRWRTWHFNAPGEWDAFCAENSAAYPIELDSDGRIKSGFFRLSTAGRDVRFGACGWVGANGVATE